jgi:2-oxoglutarate dehydrogenase E1 component
MDKFSFLNAVHSQFIEDMYLQYQKYPDSVEPSWKSFFQGFDFALENYGEETAVSQYAQQAVSTGNVHEDILTEFKVVNLIEAYRKSVLRFHWDRIYAYQQCRGEKFHP